MKHKLFRRLFSAFTVILLPLILTAVLSCSAAGRDDSSLKNTDELSGKQAENGDMHETGGTGRETASEKDKETEGGTGFSATMGLEPVEVDWESFRYVSVRAGSKFSNAAKAAGGNNWLLTIKISAEENVPALSGRVRLSDPDEGKSRQYTINAAPPDQSLYFTKGSAGFFPSVITAEVEGPGRITAVLLKPDSLVSENLEEKITPVPADPGVILVYDESLWRRDDYELFSWSIIPEILLFDFRDYDIQRKYFARLAYFVGVAGESGRIEEESYYEGRHVFNAHDYRPEDMADFYNRIGEKGLSLNSEEEILKQIALNNGIIKKENNKFLPGTGAILSVSRETPSWLRRRLLAHEAMHGLFYVSEDFRNRCFALWETMSEEEQTYWKLFLGNKGRLDNRPFYTGYAIENHYLLVNEIVGHMMQLNRSEVNSYFLDIYLGRLESLFPEKQAVFTSIRENTPEIFMNTRNAMEGFLSDIFGLKNGSIFSVALDPSQ